MAWTASAAFRQLIADMIGNTTAFDYDADTMKLAGFDNTITPDKNVSAANSAYGAGVWASGGVSGTNFPAAGVTLASKTVLVSTNNVVTIDAADPAITGTSLTNLTGLLCYDDTLTTPVADQGQSYHYLGGSNTVTGDVNLILSTNGLVQYTLT
ncbi:MAG: hypothetical protein ABW046_22540 [Actinoplanes sp.]